MIEQIHVYMIFTLTTFLLIHLVYNNFDYLYLSEKLTDFSGKALHSKKNHIPHLTVCKKHKNYTMVSENEQQKTATENPWQFC